MAKTKAKSPFEGLWHIVSMDQWDEDYFNEKVQAFIEFEANGSVQGYMLHGMIVIHLGDESDFVAKRAKAPKRPKKRK